MSQVCISCGACCASFRVSFYWAETDAHPDGRVPVQLTIPITPHHVAMRGTELGNGRCVALSGEIGHHVGCTIYPQRATPCREFEAGEERCNQVRQRMGLPPI